MQSKIIWCLSFSIQFDVMFLAKMYFQTLLDTELVYRVYNTLVTNQIHAYSEYMAMRIGGAGSRLTSGRSIHTTDHHMYRWFEMGHLGQL